MGITSHLGEQIYTTHRNTLQLTRRTASHCNRSAERSRTTRLATQYVGGFSSTLILFSRFRSCQEAAGRWATISFCRVKQVCVCVKEFVWSRHTNTSNTHCVSVSQELHVTYLQANVTIRMFFLIHACLNVCNPQTLVTALYTRCTKCLCV